MGDKKVKVKTKKSSPIRLAIPSIEEDDIRAVRKVLQSGFLIQGKKVSEFENLIADYTGTKSAVAVSNCTAALHLSLLALDVKPGDMVLVTAYSWISTANVISLCGAQPIFIDIKPDTFNIDPDCLEKTLKDLAKSPATARRIKAIIPVHTFGQPAEMTKIMPLAEKYGLPVIEDAACALGATYNGRQAGTFGLMGCFSFHPRKAITTGEGGIIITNNVKMAKKLRVLRNHGQDPESKSPDFILPGFNYRMTEFQGALGISQMRKLKRIISARRNQALYYNTLLEKPPISIPFIHPHADSVYQSYVILLPKKSASRRDSIITELKKRNIETTIGTYNMPMTSFFRTRYKYQPKNFPVTNDVFTRSITLPLHEHLTLGMQENIVKALLELV